MRLAAREVKSIGSTAGTLAAVSTAGSIVGTFAMAFLLVPAFPIEPLVFGTGAVLGLGVGMLPTLYSAKAPEIALTSVEIDPEVVRVAREYLDFRPDANDRVLVGDGRLVLEREKGPWHAVFLDAYFSDSVPYHLTTREFFELCRSRLSPGGVFAANLGGIVMGRDQRLFWAIVKTAQEAFPNVAILSHELASGQERFLGNAILVATDSPDRLSRDRVLAEGDRLAAALGHPPIAAWARAFHAGELQTANVPVLTDSYSPTDAMQHLGK
jgi:spermidine synthase